MLLKQLLTGSLTICHPNEITQHFFGLFCIIGAFLN